MIKMANVAAAVRAELSKQPKTSALKRQTQDDSITIEIEVKDQPSFTSGSVTIVAA